MKISDKIREKLDRLPDKPGVYLMRDRHGRIIYIGKARSLRSRVRWYFQQATKRSAEPKLRGLIRSIDDLDFIEHRSEAEAVLNEGRLIKEYRPRYNVTFKDDKRFLLIRIDLREPFPRLRAARIDKQDGSDYFGPYASSAAARVAMEFCEKRFGLRVCRPRVPGPEDYKHCMNDIIRFCSAPCVAKVTREDYLERVGDACAFLRGERPEILEEVRRQMEEEAAAHHFERAAAYRDTLFLLQDAVKRQARGEKSLEVKQQEAEAGVRDLEKELRLPRRPNVIECFDISNISGTYAVGSMVCAVNGLPQRNRYRMFRIKTREGIDDPGMMAEVIQRRYSRILKEGGELPDLVLVDGGITQLRAAQAELTELGFTDQPVAGLAKRFEEIYYEQGGSKTPVRLPLDSDALKVLRRIRDEAHRFALTYHRKIRRQRIQDSLLDEIPGVGKKRKQILLEHFGSVARLQKASEEEIAQVPGIGAVFARQVKQALQ